MVKITMLTMLMTRVQELIVLMNLDGLEDAKASVMGPELQYQQKGG